MKRSVMMMMMMMMSLLACGPEIGEVDEPTATSAHQLAVCYPDCPGGPSPTTVTQLVTNGGFEAQPNFSGWTSRGYARVDTVGSGYCAVGSRCAILGRYGASEAGIIDGVSQSVTLPSAAKKVQLSFWAYVYAFRAPVSGENFTVALEDSSGRIVRTFVQINPNSYAIEGHFTGWARFGPYDVTDLKGRTLRFVAKDYRFFVGDDLEWRLDAVSVTSTQ